jgi:mono/diheme cytochrome c family protein
VSKTQISRTTGDLTSGGAAKLLRLSVDFAAEDPRVIGVGNTWLALFYAGAAHIVSCDGKALSIQDVPAPEEVYGTKGPKAGGKADDDKSLWLWGKDGLRVLPANVDPANPLWLRTQVYFDLKDSTSVIGAAIPLALKNNVPEVLGDILVLTDKGAFLSDVAEVEPLPAPAPSSAPTAGALTFARDIKPLNDKYCISCHGAGAAAGDYSTEKTWLDDKANMISRVEVAIKGKAGVMPTVSYPQQPTDEERNKMVKFLSGG